MSVAPLPWAFSARTLVGSIETGRPLPRAMPSSWRFLRCFDGFAAVRIAFPFFILTPLECSLSEICVFLIRFSINGMANFETVFVRFLTFHGYHLARANHRASIYVLQEQEAPRRMGRHGASNDEGVMDHVEQPVRVSIRFPPALVAVIDDYRPQLEQIPDQAQAIKQLCEKALATTGNSNMKPRAKAPRKPR